MEITGAYLTKAHSIFLTITKNILSLVPKVPPLAILISSGLQIVRPFTIATEGWLVVERLGQQKTQNFLFPPDIKKTDIRVLRPYPPTVKLFTAPTRWAWFVTSSQPRNDLRSFGRVITRRYFTKNCQLTFILQGINSRDWSWFKRGLVCIDTTEHWWTDIFGHRHSEQYQQQPKRVSKSHLARPTAMVWIE